jgi:hypothetical protein
MSRIGETQFAAFTQELEKISSRWYTSAAHQVGATAARTLGRGARNAGTGISNFGKRQLHGLTGWTPEAGIESIGAGAANARKWQTEAATAVKKNESGAPQSLRRARESVRANETAQDMGLTSLPGTVKAFAKDPRAAAKASWDQQWNGTSRLEKGLLIGLPAAGLANDAISEDDGHKGERLGAGIASTAAGIATGGLPLIPGMIAGTAAGYLGGKAGHGVDRLRGKVQAPPNPEDAKGLAVPAEREMSPAASGQSQVFG